MSKIYIENGRGKNLLLFEEESEETSTEDIYCEDMVEDFSDNDEISLAEEGFMIGYLAA